MGAAGAPKVVPKAPKGGAGGATFSGGEGNPAEGGYFASIYIHTYNYSINIFKYYLKLFYKYITWIFSNIKPVIIWKNLKKTRKNICDVKPKSNLQTIRQFADIFGPYWKNLHWLSERLASLGIMGSQLRASLKRFNAIELWCTGGFRVALNFFPHDAERS